MGNIKRETNMERKMFRAWASYIKYKARKGTICRYTAHLLLHILNRKNRWTNIKNNNICRYCKTREKERGISGKTRNIRKKERRVRKKERRVWKKERGLKERKERKAERKRGLGIKQSGLIRNKRA